MRLIIVSGRSGSGKSTALDVLEDNGFYCIDNLPAGLLPDLAERFLPHSDMLLPQVAVSIDARNLLSQLKRFPELLEEVRKRNIRCDVLYLDAEDETLLKRFSETRRRHPLTNDNRSLAEAIAYESQLLAPITDRADLKIDTHGAPVDDPVWALLTAAYERIGRPVPTCLERDFNIPDLAALSAEVGHIARLQSQAAGRQRQVA